MWVSIKLDRDAGRGHGCEYVGKYKERQECRGETWVRILFEDYKDTLELE